MITCEGLLCENLMNEGLRRYIWISGRRNNKDELIKARQRRAGGGKRAQQMKGMDLLPGDRGK